MKVLKYGGDIMYVILVYDISLKPPGNRIWKKTFNACKRYLNHIQNSVFEGEMSEAQIQHLEIEIKKYIRSDIDSVIIFKSRNERWLEKEMWGMKFDATSPFL